MKIISIACVNFNKAIGLNNNLLYKIPKELNNFKNITQLTNNSKKNAVLMGSKTFMSIPSNFKPLDNRFNLIISKNNYTKIYNEIKKYKYKNSFVFSNIEQSIQFAKNNQKINNLFICGGSKIYNYFHENNYLDKLFINEIVKPKNNIGDTFMHDITSKYKLYEYYTDFNKNIKTTYDNNIISNVAINYKKFNNINKKKFILDSDEFEYLNMLDHTLKTGETRKTRNYNTISKFGLKLNFNLEKGFPLITTKKMFYKGVFEELLWFINGNTNSKILENKNVNIWKANSSRKYLDNNGFKNYDEGCCGPIYGYQWRNFNHKYDGVNTQISNPIDQLQNCIHLIKNNPFSRRIFMTAWNPLQLNEMVLPPCHVSYQFYVTNSGKLNCQMYQIRK